MLTYLFQRLDRFLFGRPKFSLFTTIYFNFRVLPFRQAIKLPIYLYGKWCFKTLCGTVQIQSDKICRGMLKMGNDFASYFVASISNITLHKGSTFVIHKGAKIGQGVQITLYPDSKFELMPNSSIGDNVTIICSNYIKIGERTDITWNCQLMDTNSHYVENLGNGIVRNINGKIVIGKYCWICNNTHIMANTILPNYVIATSNSILNKNYINNGVEEYSMIGGAPAKLIKNQVRRLYDSNKESELHAYFRDHPEEQIFKI